MHTMNNTITLALSTAITLMGSLVFSTSASADDQDACGEVLARLSEVGEDLGYNIDPAVSGFSGTLGRTQLNASCSGGHVELELLEGRGSAVSVNFSAGGKAFAFELLGEYPGLGSISRTGMADDASADPMTGFLNFTAEMGAESAFVEFDLAGEVVASSGDAELVNDRFAPVLNASTIWKHAHVLTFALTGMWDPGVAQHEDGLDMMLDLAVPFDPLIARDKDTNAALGVCAAATATCGVAVFFPAASGGCVHGTHLCIAAVACIKADCQGDG